VKKRGGDRRRIDPKKMREEGGGIGVIQGQRQMKYNLGTDKGVRSQMGARGKPKLSKRAKGSKA